MADLIDAEFNVEQVRQRGEVDINFFAGLCLPDICTSPLPNFYVLIWQLLANRKVEDMGRILRFALGLPRSHAKTTFIKILICWLIVYDKVKFILIVCASEPLAENLLADISDVLSSPNLESVYGSWAAALSKDSVDLKKALYHGRAVTLVAKGAGSSLRGINIKNNRPDLIFCDDMQTRENDESLAEKTKLLNWFTATLIKCIAPKGNRLIIYVGNMYSEECILRQLQNNPKWLSLVTGAILDNGQPLWPELFSLEDLLESYEHDDALGLGALWFAEIMNDPKAAGKSLLPLPLPVLPYEEDEIIPDGVFLTVDPSGFKLDSDDNVITLHYVYDGKSLAWDRIYGKDITDPEQLVLKALTMAVEHRATVIGVEDVAFQSTLAFWFNKYMKEADIRGVDIVPLQPRGRTKESRIRLYVEDLYAGNSYQTSKTRPAFTFQAHKYKLGKKNNKDDILDCDAYSLDIRNDYWHLVSVNREVAAAVKSIGVVVNNTPF